MSVGQASSISASRVQVLDNEQQSQSAVRIEVAETIPVNLTP